MPEGFARWHFSLLEIGASRKQAASFRNTTNLHSNTFFPAPSVLPTSTCFRLAPVHNGKKAVDESASYAL